MSYQTITVAVEGGVATVTLNRPEVMNALSSLLRAELLEAWQRVEREARCIVLTGAGRAFCSGQDLQDAMALGQMDLGRVLAEEYEPLLRAIYDCPVPTIAAVNGAAAGAGANLALACDVVIACESASFIQAFTRIGLIPDAGGTYWLPRQVGMARAMGAALFAEKIGARQAADWGMIWEAVPDEAFAAHVSGRAAALARGPGAAYRLVKQALRASPANGLEAQLALEARLQAEAGATADFREGVAAFLEKRPPRFEGR
ncbi:2-(1,2-epoxy-1,2-dihydrophenyl)acetyl-CoA isomerase [Rhodobacter sp. HX-7-19]|uniref:2-(1,2-epoxy-1,2-dihydrophenyl)acetyl-CoA isomerase n=1 Tax=Paragemmobacter kunshanensis TaxID=2583234 RepID=A0A6M1TZ48_9RHOB|nr:enoyl-CoA hydratase-related protein [Rhodobacter kunshanensis]NGQ92016.1 2-(1,2-epoxy-1,2-dihydrophenyl)acetyl-CoA isomerase [Rhodobacter kunshanensis]